jgi:hypothetical protein
MSLQEHEIDSYILAVCLFASVRKVVIQKLLVV